ncbi:MAG: aminoacyl--tRNA ligase-related protein [Candidatus Paceibacterota bacterium]
MRQSQLFTKTRREAPSDEVAKSAQLLVRGGFIHKEMAGVYDYLPLGLRVLKNIMQVIREEVNKIGGQEILMTTLQDKEVWEKSGRWDESVVDIWFKTKLANGTELGVANTHEEPLTALLREHISSHKDLPKYIYQFQNKFRNELRAKSGIMRTREFIMKDMYSFSRNEEEFKEFYEKSAEAYGEIFKRLGIGAQTYRTLAAGGSFTSGLTDEFQTICDAGEDTIYIDEEKKLAVNKEVYTDDVLKEHGLKKENMKEARAVEVGNIFPLGSKYSEALGLLYKDEDGSSKPVIMGSYGIGPGRVMGTIVETLADDKGIIWPEEIAPFLLHLVALKEGAGDELYEELVNVGVETLYDDRTVNAGEKFADSDLIGIPYRAIVGGKNREEGKIEVVKRSTGETEFKSKEELIALCGRTTIRRSS